MATEKAHYIAEAFKQLNEKSIKVNTDAIDNALRFSTFVKAIDSLTPKFSKILSLNLKSWKTFEISAIKNNRSVLVTQEGIYSFSNGKLITIRGKNMTLDEFVTRASTINDLDYRLITK